ncbi:MAG: hypothetical protein ABI779_12545 [Acidobacteriota bacterium]
MAKKIRLMGLVVLLLVGATSLVAMPDHEVYTEFYTDGTYAVECGYRWVTCHGIIREGCQNTGYSVTYDGDDC